MPKPKVMRQWVEMSQGFIYDGPPKREDYEACIFLNHCELREKPKAGRYIMRQTGVEFLRAPTKDAMNDSVARFLMREDVRLLAKGLEANDFDTLPRQDNEPDDDVIEGIADIYDVHAKDEATG